VFLKVVAPQLQVLLNVTGTQWNPVKQFQVQGIKFIASAYTYMMPHGVPSAGDWALDRYGAVFLQGTEQVTLADNTFERLDGNAVMVPLSFTTVADVLNFGLGAGFWIQPQRHCEGF
jgi:hypothetical protein